MGSLADYMAKMKGSEDEAEADVAAESDEPTQDASSMHMERLAKKAGVADLDAFKELVALCRE